MDKRVVEAVYWGLFAAVTLVVVFAFGLEVVRVLSESHGVGGVAEGFYRLACAELYLLLFQGLYLVGFQRATGRWSPWFAGA